MKSVSTEGRYNSVMYNIQMFFQVITVNYNLLYFNIGVLIALICCKINTNDFVFTQR